MQMTLIKADTPNKNNRVYSSAVCEKIVKQCYASVILGKVGESPNLDVQSHEISHCASDFVFQDGDLKCAVTVLNTPAGKRLQEMIATEEIVFRLSGVGSIKPPHQEGEPNTVGANNAVMVADDYILISVVALPLNTAA